jgi:hypothetical protein
MEPDDEYGEEHHLWCFVGFMILKYSSLEFVEARRVEAWNLQAKNFDWGLGDTTKILMSSSKCRSVEVINNPARPGSNHKEVNCINYK